MFIFCVLNEHISIIDKSREINPNVNDMIRYDVSFSNRKIPKKIISNNTHIINKPILT